jgi:hypothetical protein
VPFDAHMRTQESVWQRCLVDDFVRSRDESREMIMEGGVGSRKGRGQTERRLREIVQACGAAYCALDSVWPWTDGRMAGYRASIASWWWVPLWVQTVPGLQVGSVKLPRPGVRPEANGL